MHASQRRVIPLSVSIWMEQGVKVRKETASSGLLPNNTRSNVFLSRKFYADMLDLSIERHRKLARCDYTKKMFLKNQRHRAEIGMPGLLPYIKQHQEEEDGEKDPRINPTVYSEAIQSMMKPRVKKQIDQLSQPKGRRFDANRKDHIRPNRTKPVSVHDLFGNLDETPKRYSNKPPKELEMSSTDRRFQKLIYLFSEMHERDPTMIQSVKDLVQSKSSLQNNARKVLSTFEYDDPSDLFTYSSFSKTNLTLTGT